MIKLILFTVGIYVVVAKISDPTQLCGELLTLDCRNYITPDRDETVCGTNDVTYINFCYYSQARCNDKTLDLKNVGACGATMPPATVNTMTVMATGSVVPVSTLPPTTTLDPILEAFCGNKNNIVCGTDLSPICGSDKQFYLNKCEYSKAYCDDKTLRSKPIDFCTGGTAGK